MNTSATGIIVSSAFSGGTSLTFRATAQAGTRVVDEVEISTNLMVENSWIGLASYTNTVALDDASFESGWGEILLPAGGLLATNPGPVFLRIRRQWLSP